MIRECISPNAQNRLSTSRIFSSVRHSVIWNLIIMASRFCSFQETGTVLCKLTPSHIYNLHNKRFMATITRGQNLVEKIVQKHLAENSSSDPVFSGDFVSVSPAYVMTHDNTAAVMQKYVAYKWTNIYIYIYISNSQYNLGDILTFLQHCRYHDLHVKKLHNPSQAVFTLDHNVQDTSGKHDFLSILFCNLLCLHLLLLIPPIIDSRSAM